MDSELKAYLEEKFQGVDGKFDGMEKKFDAIDKKFDGIEKKFDAMEKKFDGIEKKFDGIEKKFVDLENSVAGEIGSLHMQIIESEARMTKRWEAISERLDRQAGMLRAGSIALSRFDTWSDKSDARWLDLLARVEKIEDQLRPKQ